MGNIKTQVGIRNYIDERKKRVSYNYKPIEDKYLNLGASGEGTGQYDEFHIEMKTKSDEIRIKLGREEMQRLVSYFTETLKITNL